MACYLLYLVYTSCLDSSCIISAKNTKLEMNYCIFVRMIFPWLVHVVKEKGMVHNFGSKIIMLVMYDKKHMKGRSDVLQCYIPFYVWHGPVCINYKWLLYCFIGCVVCHP